MNYYYQFPAVKGIQANRQYYVSMVPLKLLSKLFISDNDVVLPEYRAQRRINEARIPEIRDYILNNRSNYVFSALSASIDGEFEFEAFSDDIGMLKVSMNATFLINDGQHRKAAIESAMIEDPSLANESISIVFFEDEGLKRSQQMFADLNKHAVKTSNSLATLYDSRDEIAVSTKNIINSINFFKRYTDMERDNLGKNSSKLFTLNNIYKANQKIIHSSTCTMNDEIFLLKFWREVATNIVEWQEVMDKSITKKELRENYIISLAITLSALGRLGRYFYDNPNIDMASVLTKLKNINWLRSNEDWLGRTIRSDGKVLNSESASNDTYIKIKMLLGLELTKDEIKRDKKLMESV